MSAPPRRLAISLALLALLCAWPALAAGRRAHRSIPQGFMGAMVEPDFFGTGAELDREMGAMAANGVESVRVPIYWGLDQPRADSAYDFTRADQVIRAARRHGLRVLAVVLQAPPWARVHPESLWSEPSDVGAYTRFLAAAVSRYAPLGVHDWQVWNEPNGPYFWNDGFDAHGNPVEAPFDHYVALLRAAHAAIKGADPRSRVVLAGLIPASFVRGVAGSTTALRALYAAGARDLFDVVTIHPYTRRVSDVLLLLRQLRHVMDQNGDTRKPLSVTELSWPSAAGKLARGRYFGYETTERGQAAKVRSAYLALAGARRQLGIEQVDWYAWSSPDRGRDIGFKYAGLVRWRGSLPERPKPALTAYRDVARVLEGCAKSTQATRCR